MYVFMYIAFDCKISIEEKVENDGDFNFFYKAECFWSEHLSESQFKMLEARS